MLRVPAPAKINLFLHVGARRADGYHALQSLVCFSEAGDTLTFEPAETLSLVVNGPFAEGLEAEEDNLILRAARMLSERAGCSRGAAITLTKNLPVASGIGGGSADAAAALRGLPRLWAISVPGEALHEVALSLGSDVPVCLKSGPAMMEGRGEHVTPVGALPRASMLLVNPGVAVPTGEVFRRLGRTEHDVLPAIPPLPRVSEGLGGLLSYLQQTRNDMEDAARTIAPAIDTVLDALGQGGAAMARMCGSGATCYGLFESEAQATEAARKIKAAYPAWWVSATRIAAPDHVSA